MPDNLSHLGDYGKGSTLAEFEWHLARIGEVDYKDQGDWGSFYAKGATDFMKVQGRVFGQAGYDDWTVTAGVGVQGRLEIVGSHYEAGYDSPSFYNLGGHDLNLRTKVNADAYVGASGFAEAEVGIGKDTHLNLGAGGFDGASAALKGRRVSATWDRSMAALPPGPESAPRSMSTPASRIGKSVFTLVRAWPWASVSNTTGGFR